MSLTIKDMLDKRHDEEGKLCGFTLELKAENNRGMEVVIPFYYTRCGEAVSTWEITMVLKDAETEVNTQAVTIRYIVPKSNMPIEQIAGIGLVNIQSILQAELQIKESLLYEIAEAIS